MDALDRFMAKVNDVGCWEWTAALSKTGYAVFSYQGRQWKGHRWSYIFIGGNEIPDGYHVDHLCRNKACVNPRHLEAVTPKENTVRHHALTTKCPRGHAYDEENTYVNKKGQRSCRECSRARTRESLRRDRAQRPEHWAEYFKTYYQQNKDAINARRRAATAKEV